jgi:competence protein ComEC
MEKFSIGRVLISKTAQQSDSPSFQKVLDRFSTLNIPVQTICRGDDWSIGANCKVSVLSPTNVGFGENDNADSVVLMVNQGRQKFLLPGDIEKSGLDWLLRQSKIDFDMMMAAHHGSKNSAPSAMMTWSTPEWVVISGSRHRVSESSAARFLEPGTPRRVLQTHQQGAIRFRFFGSTTEVDHWQDDSWSPITLGSQ